MLDQLIRSLQNGTDDERRIAAQQLGDYGTEATLARPALVEALRDRYHAVRVAASQALAKLGLCPESARPIIVELFLYDDEKENRYATAWTLQMIGLFGPNAMDFVRAWVADEIIVVRAAGARVMALIGIDPSVEIPILNGMIETESDPVVILIILERIQALGSSAVSATLPALIRKMRADNFVQEISEFFESVRSPETLDALESLLADEDDDLKLVAAQTLVRLGGDVAPRAIPALRMLKGRNPANNLGKQAEQLLATFSH